MKITNFDEFKSKNVTFQISGKKLTVPARLPLYLSMVLIQYQDAMKDQSIEKIDDVYRDIFKFIQEHNKDYTYPEFVQDFDTETFSMLVNFLYAGIEPEKTREIIEDVLNSADIDKKK